MRLVPTDIAKGWYADEALSWAAMRTVNYLPEAAESEGTRTVSKLATPPGLRVLVDLQTNAPVRGIEDVEGRLFAVSGTSLFEITSSLTKINRGTIPGVGRVSMAHNKQGGATAANELAIANGLSGYVYNTSTTTLTQITDSAFEGASTFDYIDGYSSFTDPQGRFWGHSELNQALQYSSIDRYDAESAPDKITSHIVSHREVIVWGPRTGEFFRNTGAATGTFQRVDGTEMEVGICSTFARARVDNTVCWVGNDMTVYRLDGHSPRRISTRPIEQMLSHVDPNNIFCYAWEDRGHKVFYVTSPNNFTLGFDFASGLWHERQSYGLDQWRINALARWNNQWIAGDYVNGLLYVVDWDVYTENGQPMVSEAATGYTVADQNKVIAAYVELIFDTGGGLGTIPDELAISGDMAGGFVGDAVAAGGYVATGGYPGYTYSVISGSLPPGITIDSVTGAWSGTFTTEGSFSWTVQVTDSVGNTATTSDSALVDLVEWTYLADAYGAGLGGTSTSFVPLSFGSISGQDALLIAGPREASDAAGTGSRFYLSTNYAQSFSFTYVPTTLSTQVTLIVNGAGKWISFDSRSTFVFDGATHTYYAGSVKGSWAGGTWVCGAWTGSYFVGASNSDGMFRSATGVGSTWSSISANLPGGGATNTVLGMEAFNGVGVNPAHGALVAMHTGTTDFIRSFDSGSTWSTTTFTTPTAGTKTYACSAKHGSRAVFVTTVSNGASSGLEFIYTDDYGVTFSSVFVLYSSMPSDLTATPTRWKMVWANNTWHIAASQGGAGTKTVIATVSSNFTTLAMENIINAPAPLATGSTLILSSVTADNRRAVYGWRRVGGAPALLVYR